MYTINLTLRAQKDLDRLPGQLFERVLSSVAASSENPRPNGHQKLHRPDNGFRIWVGDYRILYDIDDVRHEVLILRVKHRREAHRES